MSLLNPSEPIDELKTPISAVVVTPVTAVVPHRVFVVPQFLSRDECQRLIAASEVMGFQEAGVNTGRAVYTANAELMRKDIRNNDRLVHENPILADMLFLRLKTILCLDPSFLRPAISVPVDTIHSLSSRFRFYRYRPGQRFKPHRDRLVSAAISCDENNGKEPQNQAQKTTRIHSLYTMLIFLIDDVQGGGTKFTVTLTLALVLTPVG